MSEKISKRILIGELVIIVLPSSLLLLFATIYQISLTINPFPWFLWDWYNFANTLFALLACTALVSGLIISQKFLRHGKAGLDTVETKWWIFSVLGAVLAITSAVVALLPSPPEYSAEENFRQAFDSFRLGILIFIPFTHLLLEKYLRKI
jgi:hypothetical protein